MGNPFENVDQARGPESIAETIPEDLHTSRAIPTLKLDPNDACFETVMLRQSIGDVNTQLTLSNFGPASMRRSGVDASNDKKNSFPCFPTSQG